jgi:DNA-binding transcriptional LysR family regulator
LKFLTYRSGDGRFRPGVLEGGLIRTIATPTLRDYLELAPHERVAWHTADELVELQSVTLDAPVRPSRNVFAWDATIWSTRKKAREPPGAS